MVVATPTPIVREKVKYIDLPIIDLLGDKSEVAKQIVKACEEFGFFKVINHGVPTDIIAKMEEETVDFFAKPDDVKLLAGPPRPLGYGRKNIGCNGDVGEIEFLLLHANPNYVSQISKLVNNGSTRFSSVVNQYTEAVKGLACEILELMAQGLSLPDKTIFSNLIKKDDHDNVFRLNHYPPICKIHDLTAPGGDVTGFGEHSDPQILTLLRSNDVGGLQICLEDKVWVPVDPDPTAYTVNVGDLLQVMTNERFKSVRHRAITSSYTRSRMSMGFFGGPPLSEGIDVLPEMVTPAKPALYKPFTWGEFKRVGYTLRVADIRANFFKIKEDE
ncbi:hypothetical protein UlMin_009183 [Ulmus minor]